jgi:hypothetical protein
VRPERADLPIRRVAPDVPLDGAVITATRAVAVAARTRRRVARPLAIRLAIYCTQDGRTRADTPDARADVTCDKRDYTASDKRLSRDYGSEGWFDSLRARSPHLANVLVTTLRLLDTTF